MAFTRIPLRRSFLAGGLAYLIGYGLTFLLTIGRTRTVLSETVVRTPSTEPTSLAMLLRSPPPTSVLVGWLFHNSFWAATQIPIPDATGSGTTLVVRNLIAAAGDLFLVLYLIPPLVLIVAGYVAAHGRTPGLRGELYAGGATMFGFLLFVVVGAFMFSVSISGTTVVAAPELTSIFSGIAYPVVFGSLGGALVG
jgi:hypothetical protein